MGTLKSYHVMWEIDLDATSAEDAARRALKIQRDPGSMATVFDVTEENCDDAIKEHTERIDLEEISQAEQGPQQ